ncbi:hypothetical protein [uncultured Lactobacillus sp.]|uniref:hypothetical protein n=1 Tax=uncultured Lactobacillus sp. TaxID=153152 RepID=UPI0025ED5039|nr:hypothetical protein [uncultured Lactobacillus sp.]
MGLYKTCAICGKKLTFNNQGYPLGNEKICFEDNSYLAKALGYKIPLGIKDTVKFELAKRQLPFEEAKNLIEQKKLKESINTHKALRQLKQEAKSESEIPSEVKSSESIPDAEAIVENNIDNNKVLKTTDNNQTEKISAISEQPVQKAKQKSSLEKAVEGLNNVSSFLNALNQPHCPRCRSTNIQVLGQHRKGFSIGKAAAGTILTGGIGSLAGFAGKNTKKVDMICMNCGKKFQYKGK